MIGADYYEIFYRPKVCLFNNYIHIFVCVGRADITGNADCVDTFFCIVPGSGNAQILRDIVSKIIFCGSCCDNRILLVISV